MTTRQIARKTGSSGSRRRIMDAAIRSYREIGYRKTSMADVARGASMSPANVYRFFPSRQSLEEAVVAELLDEILMAAATAGGSNGSSLQRLSATLRTLSRLATLLAGAADASAILERTSVQVDRLMWPEAA